jgi:hypothetical protein
VVGSSVAGYFGPVYPSIVANQNDWWPAAQIDRRSDSSTFTQICCGPSAPTMSHTDVIHGVNCGVAGGSQLMPNVHGDHIGRLRRIDVLTVVLSNSRS